MLLQGCDPGVRQFTGGPWRAPASTSPQLPAFDKVEFGHVCECRLVWETVLETYQHKLSDCWQLFAWWKIIVILSNVLSYKAGVTFCCRHLFPLGWTYLQVKATHFSLLFDFWLDFLSLSLSHTHKHTHSEREREREWKEPIERRKVPDPSTNFPTNCDFLMIKASQAERIINGCT